MSDPVTAETILERLVSDDPAVVRDALREAPSIREELVPRLLEIVRTQEPEGDEESAKALPYLAWYLLAQFRETRAFEPIIQFYRTWGPDADIDAGDVTNEDLPRILASMWTGDLDLLEAFVLDESASEWARAAAARTVVVALMNDLIPYEEAEEWLDQLMATRVRREASYVWDTLFVAATHLGSRRLLERALPLVDLAEMDDYRDEIRAALLREPGLLRDWQTTARHYKLVDDAADATSWWAFFQPLRPQSPGRIPELRPDAGLPLVPRTGPKVGRNEPCPCGSGRKFKKCCGG